MSQNSHKRCRCRAPVALGNQSGQYSCCLFVPPQARPKGRSESAGRGVGARKRNVLPVSRLVRGSGSGESSATDVPDGVGYDIQRRALSAAAPDPVRYIRRRCRCRSRDAGRLSVIFLCLIGRGLRVAPSRPGGARAMPRLLRKP